MVGIYKKTVKWFFSLFGYVKEDLEMMKVEGKPLYINLPFESKERLARAISRLKTCKDMLNKMDSDDPKRKSWESEVSRREYEIERFGEVN